MAIYEKLKTAFENRDADAYSAVFSDDSVFVRHQSGAELTKPEHYEMMKKMMSNDKLNIQELRCIYENDEVLVTHASIDFPDDTSESIIMVGLIRDGQIYRTETGATPVQR